MSDGSMGMEPVYLWIEFGGHDYNQESDRGLFEIWRKGRLIILLTMYIMFKGDQFVD